MGTIDEVSFIRLDVVAVVSLLGFYLEKELQFGFLFFFSFFILSLVDIIMRLFSDDVLKSAVSIY